MAHIVELYAHVVRITLIRWKGETVVMGKNQAMKMLLEAN